MTPSTPKQFILASLTFLFALALVCLQFAPHPCFCSNSYPILTNPN